MSDPVAIARLMLREPGLSGRLALAIDHLEEEWKSLPLTVRFPNGVDEEYKALRKEVIELADPGNLELDQINQKLGEWLRGKAPHADLRVLLGYVTAVDLAIEPFLDAPQILRFLSSDWSTGQEDQAEPTAPTGPGSGPPPASRATSSMRSKGKGTIISTSHR